MVDAEPEMTERPTAGRGAAVRHHVTRARERWRKLPLPVKILLGILGFLFAIWLILFITKGRFLKRPFEQIVGSQLERDVRVGGDFQLYFAPFSIKLLAEKARIADSRPAPTPRMTTSTSLRPIDRARSASISPTLLAANGVPFFEPEKPIDPLDDQSKVLPAESVSASLVLL